MNILFVSSSPRGAAAHSTILAERLVGRLRAADPHATLVRRDVAADPPPFVGEDFVTGPLTPEDQRSPGQREAIALSDAYGAELAAADTIVIAAAMINFSIPTPLRSWFDHLLRAGLTFRYTAHGSVGTMGGRKVYLVLARGGIYSEGRFRDSDFQLPYLRTLLGFMGMDDIEVILAEGTAMGADSTTAAIAAANERIDAMVGPAGGVA